MGKRNKSKYDELHDRYQKILTEKSGTRYERLAALVFKSLDAKSAVIHDLKLEGVGAGVRHQIDVTIDQQGAPRRILLECKDFDTSGKKVGLGIARDFRSVIEDTGTDEGWLVSCVGFTKGAKAYAKSKNIKLLKLRVFEEQDMLGRIKQINVNLHAVFPINTKVTFDMTKEAQKEYSRQIAPISDEEGVGIDNPVYVVSNDHCEQFNVFLSAEIRKVLDVSDDANRIEGTKKTFEVPSDGKVLQIGNGPAIAFERMLGEFEIGIQTQTFEVVSDRIAELLIEGFGDEDMIVFGDQLQRFTIDLNTGEVCER